MWHLFGDLVMGAIQGLLILGMFLFVFSTVRDILLVVRGKGSRSW